MKKIIFIAAALALMTACADQGKVELLEKQLAAKDSTILVMQDSINTLNQKASKQQGRIEELEKTLRRYRSADYVYVEEYW